MLILGSQSARRKEILSFFRLPFEQHPSPYDERQLSFTGDPVAYATALAKGKAVALSSRFPDKPILTADTVVFKEGQLFCKPASDEEGFAMLNAFNGQWHTVFTALALAKGKTIITDYEQTQVLFHSLTQEQLHRYHRAFAGRDKAGGYGIQEGGSLIIKKIEGCFYNVMGLPLTALRNTLAKMEIDLWHYL